MKRETIDRTTLETAVKAAKSAEDAGRMVGRRGPYIKKYARIYGIDTSHFPGKDGKLNLLGKKFGRLTVVDEADRRPDGAIAWKCICECGKETDVRSCSLTCGSTKSCGCLKPETWHFMFEANTKYSPVDASAIMVWRDNYDDGGLSFESFKQLSAQDCFYCALPPSNVANSCKHDPKAAPARQKEADYRYSGLDRIDCTSLHTIDNVVPCCYYCNFAKNDLAFDVFKSHLVMMVSHRTTKCAGDFASVSVPKLTGKFRELLKPKEKALPVSSVAIGMMLGRLTVIKKVSEEWPTKFLCRCECGTETVVSKYDLMNGKTRSCNGGLCRGKYSPYVSTARSAYHSSRYSGELQFEEFFELSQMSCSYCGSQPSNCFHSVRSELPEHNFTYSGLDRLDPKSSHSVDNVVPCCIICNTMKNDRTLTDFNNWLTAINNHWLSKQRENVA
jgi:hypothetical protein